VFDLLVIAGTVRLEVITELVLVGDALLARGLHVSGQGPGTASAPLLRRAARELGQQWNARRVIIEGGVRTTGARPGHPPRRLVIPIHE
jgi:hypothetical protein